MINVFQTVKDNKVFSILLNITIEHYEEEISKFLSITSLHTICLPLRAKVIGRKLSDYECKSKISLKLTTFF